jgi:hypothetical protein
MGKAIATNSWSRIEHHPCEVIDETKTRYRVRMLQRSKLPSGWKSEGQVILVPKYAVVDYTGEASECEGCAYRYTTDADRKLLAEYAARREYERLLYRDKSCDHASCRSYP